jgi:hypothetical protein
VRHVANTHWREKKLMHLKEGEHFENLSIGGRISLKLILKK